MVKTGFQSPQRSMTTWPVCATGRTQLSGHLSTSPSTGTFDIGLTMWRITHKIPYDFFAKRRICGESYMPVIMTFWQSGEYVANMNFVFQRTGEYGLRSDKSAIDHLYDYLCMLAPLGRVMHPL